MDMRGHDALVGASYAEVVQRPQGYWDREQTKIGQRINDVVDRVKNAVHIGWCAITMDSNSLAFERQIIDHEKEMKQEWRELGPTDQAGAPRPSIDRDGLDVLEAMAAGLTEASSAMTDRLQEIHREIEPQGVLFPEVQLDDRTYGFENYDQIPFRSNDTILHQTEMALGIEHSRGPLEWEKQDLLMDLQSDIDGQVLRHLDDPEHTAYLEQLREDIASIPDNELATPETRALFDAAHDVHVREFGELTEIMDADLDRREQNSRDDEALEQIKDRPFSMTLEKLQEDKWSVLDLALPDNASMDLLQAAETAARECYDEACSEIAGYDPEDADSTGYAYEQSFNRDQAQEVLNVVGERIAEKLREEPGYYDAGGGFANDGKWVSANEDREVETLERDDEGLEL